jgi:uncharacterized protein YecE (DUF72 family)
VNHTFRRYYLGAPMWANRDWLGTLFTRKARSDDLLRQYASVFNTVEGNSTFYGLPSAETVVKWGDLVPDSFRFCFKFPREVTHEGGVMQPPALAAADAFLARLAPLAGRIGVLNIQLPPTFHGARVEELDVLLGWLPDTYRYAVEVRHADFFDGETFEHALNDLLRRRGVNRGLFNATVVHALPSHDPAVVSAQQKKPQMPDRYSVTADHPFLRFVGDPSVEANGVHIRPVADAVAGWVREGKTPYVFLHTPGDVAVPEFGRFFHEQLRLRLDELEAMPPWPGELERLDDSTAQLPLFDE